MKRENYPEDASLPEKVIQIKCLGADISEYRIVIPAGSYLGELHTADLLQYHLWKNSAVTLEITDDPTPEKEYEILIGKSRYQDEKFAVVAVGSKLKITANDLWGFRDAAAYLTGTLFGINKSFVSVNAGFSYYEKNDKLNPDHRSGKYRAIFHNVWSYNELLVNRDDYEAMFLLAYKPDIIGLQEYVDDFRNVGTVQNALVGAGYAEALPPNLFKPVIMPLYYNIKVLKLIECRYYSFFLGCTSRYKGVTCGVFEDLSTHVKFAACSLHMQANIGQEYNTFEEGNLRRISDAGILASAMRKFKDDYPDITVIAGGDCNMRAGSEPYMKLINNGINDIRNKCRKYDDTCSCHDYPTYNEKLNKFVHGNLSEGKYNAGIDHIFWFGDSIAPIEYKTVTDDTASIVSDHCPVMIDFDIKRS